MRRRHQKIFSQTLDREMSVLAFGYYGPPVIAFPSEGQPFYEFEQNGMVDAVSHLIEAGQLKLYCPAGVDHESWLNDTIDPHWRAVRHNAYEYFVVSDLVPAIRSDCRDPGIRIGLTGCGLGAYHAANFTLKFPQIFHYALCMSGRYDLAQFTGFSDSIEVYYNNPLAYVPNLEGDALDYVRSNTHLALVCGRGAWEENSLRETHQLADLLLEKGISHERDIWGDDVDHHWHWWRQQIANHLTKTFT